MVYPPFLPILAVLTVVCQFLLEHKIATTGITFELFWDEFTWLFNLKYLLIWLNKTDKRGLCRYEVFYLTLVFTMPPELPLDLRLSGGGLELIICYFIFVTG